MEKDCQQITINDAEEGTGTGATVASTTGWFLMRNDNLIFSISFLGRSREMLPGCWISAARQTDWNDDTDLFEWVGAFRFVRWRFLLFFVALFFTLSILQAISFLNDSIYVFF